MNLQGKTVVITGGAMGIGRATALRLVHEQCTVTIWDLNASALEEAATSLRKEGGKIFPHVCDVTDKARVAELSRVAVQEMGRVDIVINNAGYVQGGDFLDLSDEGWSRTIDVNLNALRYTICAFLPGMYERNEGHIVNISSAAGLIGVPGLAAYAATKWAVYGLTESMRMEAITNGKKGVHWSSIHPSYLAHGMFEGARLGKLGSLIVPLIRNHDVIARTIVESALKRGRHSPKRPLSVHLTPRMRALLPDGLFQQFLVLLGVDRSMKNWKGRGHA
jgi:all-trans-retinol dehydrogenase (NAD+)